MRLALTPICIVKKPELYVGKKSMTRSVGVALKGFHPKKHLDECSIASGHYFLPLPPYSPELNPIEQFWATLKREVTELLRTGHSVQSALEYYFKTK